MQDPDFLGHYADQLDKPRRAEIDQLVTTILGDERQRQALSGFAARLGVLTGMGGPLAAANTDQHIDLTASLNRGDVVVFSLNSSLIPGTAAHIASLVILDIMTACGTRRAHSKTSPGLMIVDEFSAIGSDHITHLFARARDAGLGVIVATQEFADLTRVDPGFCDQVISNVATTIAHRQNVPSSAELVAALAGTRAATKYTHQTEDGWLGANQTGMDFMREVQEYIIHPDKIKRLRVGETVVIRKEPSFSCEIVQITPR
ncbi:MAG: TraM recognition domain-containing protein [Thermoleophilia bacterium]|nr:TraM recognition domain-containing protein [Thermoleophilia bacterium]